MAKVIAVFGATGMQGGGVITALLKNKDFEVRAVTRNPESEKAKALGKQGAKVFQGNLDDPTSLSTAVSECYGVFGLTNYWEIFDSNREFQQGKNLIDACKAAGVKHLIFSGAPDIKAFIGKPCDHTDGKVQIEKYMLASGIPCTYVCYSLYADCFLSMFTNMTKKDDNGVFVIGIPMEGNPMDLIVVPGAGNVVAAIFATPEAYFGRSIVLSGDRKTVQECADILSKHLTPKTFKAGDVTLEQFYKSGSPVAESLGTMFEFIKSGLLIVDLEVTKKLDPTTMNFEDWVKANKDALNATYQ